MQKVAIVIPCYKSSLTKHEEIALAQCKKILGQYPVRIAKPESLILPAEILDFADCAAVNFDDNYFADIAGYNRLMLSAEFYKRFTGFEYILIYQLDAFVFKDELENWCSKGYDYIGAPWISRKSRSPLKQVLVNIQRNWSYRFDLKKRGVPNKYQFENRVGNGGFSLRRVSAFADLCDEMVKEIDYYLSQTAHQYNEDAFWSLEVNRHKKRLEIPVWREALEFCYETYPDRAFELTGHQLPFGCHDWDAYPDFWRPIFKELGYDL
ncbi:DUF5672 family protein [Mucilaginibacter ginkgonis]|uniref:Uncharacterized protein n=1 Tax=Mucilaginibacter ginkgonis TaxID=2682091 RepID=A0A6I4I2R1_9SPHI|nr:DUF5672 family protein [Mucilaginibacter ginkgonis]QQL49184.1 hypothetical protein GO620_013505 [Mucilaginibacter ginkgonis]